MTTATTILVMVLWGLAPGGGAAPASASTSTLEVVAVPRPDLSAMSAAVREQLSTARADLDAVLSRDAGAVEKAGVYADVGQLYLAYGLDSAARVCFQNAVLLDSSEIRWRYYLGALLQNGGDDPRALAELSALHNLRPDDLPTLLRLGEIELRNHRLSEARRYFQLALDAHSGSAAARWGLGRVAVETGDLDAAVTWLEETLELQPRADSVHSVLARLARRRGDVEAARHHLGLRGNGMVAFYDPLMIEVQRRTVGADAALGRGGDAQMQGLFDIAVAEYRRAVEAEPDNPAAHEALAIVLVHQGEDEAAIVEYRKALSLEERRPEAHYFLGLLLVHRGDDDEAVAHLRRAAELDPAFTATRVALGEVLLRRGETEAARQPLEEVLALDSDHVEARLALARAFAEAGQLDTAVAELDRLAGLDLERSQRARAAQYRALLRLQVGDEEGALSHLEQAVELDPELVEARFQLGDQRLRQGQPGRALPHLEAVLAAQPDHGPARLAQSGALLALGRPSEARDRLEEGLAARPNDGFLAFNLARLLACGPVEVRQGARALALAEGLWQAGQGFEHAQLMAMALAENGRFEDAIILQRQLVEAVRANGGGAILAQLEANLKRYHQGETCRLP